MRRASRARAAGSGDGVVVLGEALCDLFTPAPGTLFSEASSFVPHLGGAPANVAVQLARLGVRSALLGAVGNDPLGSRVLADLARERVDTRAVRRVSGYRTGVTLVEVAADGERRFTPLADRRADLAVGTHDVEPAWIGGFAAVHTGTVGLRAPGSRAAHRALAAAARAASRMVSLDVNLRWGMYPSREVLLRHARAAVRRADVVKATREEARALLDAGARAGPLSLARGLLDLGPRLVLLTLDVDGAFLATRLRAVEVPALPVEVVDATGAGDAFHGAALAWLVSRQVTRAGLADLDEEALHMLGAVACRAGSICCTAVGATTAMVRTLEHA